MIRRTFVLNGDPDSAKLYITGLGYFKPLVNGEEITDLRMIPAQSEYEKRDTSKAAYPITDEMRYRVYYLCFDITIFLKKGENTLDILLGNGWYRQHRRRAEGDMTYGEELKAIYSLRVVSGGKTTEINSDGSELYGDSAIRENNIYFGETVDGGFETSFTERVKAVESDGRLMQQACAPDRVVGEIAPKLIYNGGEYLIYDNGVNVTGFVEVSVNSPLAGEIELTFAENLTDDGADLDYSSASGGQIQRDLFVHPGGAAVYSPTFSWHCFRYFKIKGNFETAKTKILHTDVSPIGSFECDDQALTWLFPAFRRTFLNNLHGSIPSDCPHRERLGYTGDGQLTAEAAMYCFDLSKAYRKWIGDVFDGQGENGHIQHTAPFMGGGGGPAGWGGAAVVLPYQYYRFYGDRGFLEENYPRIVKWIGYMRTRIEDGLIVKEEPKGWCLGDWGSANRPKIPEAYVNTAYFARLLGMAGEIALLLENTGDAKLFDKYREEAKEAVVSHYFDPETGDFCENKQFANIFAINIGLGDERSAEHIRSAIRDCDGTLDIGIAAMDLLIEYLFDNGEGGLALRAIDLLTRKMRERGATTVWEYVYDQSISNCHHMFCGMIRSLFSGLLGIKLSLDGKVTFFDKAVLPESMNYAKGSTVIRGRTVTVEMTRESGKTKIKRTESITGRESGAFRTSK